MAQFDVHLANGKGPLLVNCQSDLLSHLETRLVVPLVPLRTAGGTASRLNPIFQVDGAPFVLATNLAATVSARLLGPAIASLDDCHLDIKSAIDMLVSGI